MKPSCCKCGTTDPYPIRDRDGDLVYWFKIEEDDDGNEFLYSREAGEDEDDCDTVALTGMTVKSFEVEDGSQYMCPECASEECEYIKGDIVEDDQDEDGWLEDGYDPFGEVPDIEDDEIGT